MTRELTRTRLKNNKARASKKSKDSKKRCLKGHSLSLREKYQQQQYRGGNQERSEDLFGICISKMVLDSFQNPFLNIK
jgi:hypothetical protein